MANNMNSYNLFAFSVSKYPLTKLEEIIKVDQVGLRLNDNGSNLERTIQICTNLQILVNYFFDELPLAINEPRVEIGHYYNKICSINPLLQKTILYHDQTFPSNQCAPHFNKILSILKSIGKYIPQLTTNQSSSITQYLDELDSNLTSINDLYNTIISTAKKCETELSSKISPIPENEQQISHQIAASLITFDELLIQLYFFSSNPDIQKSDNYQILQEFIQKVPELSQQLFKAKRSDEQQITAVTIDLLSEMANLSTILSKIQGQIPDSADFSNVSLTLISLMQLLNETESKITAKYIQKIVENLSNFYLEKKPLNTLITTAKTVLENVKTKIEKNFFYSSSSSIVSSYTSLSNFIEKVDDKNFEMNAVFLSSVVRLTASILSESRTGEELLVSLLVQIATIMKSLFAASNAKNGEINGYISKNLEKLDLSKLNETNYFLTAALNSNDPDIESDDFVSTQQLFFVSSGALPIPLSKLSSSCSSDNVKGKLNGFLSDLQKVSDSFSSWFNQLYLTIFSVIHLRSQMILGSLSFPLSLLHSSDLHEIQNTINEMKKIIESTPQIITGNICDVTELIENIIDLSKSGNDYLKCIRQTAESPFFPIFKLSTDAIAEIIVDIPQYMLSLGQNSLFDNSQIFIASLIASSSVSLRFMNKNEALIKSASPLIYQVLSPSLTFASFACHFVDMNPDESSELPPLISVLRSALQSLVSSLNKSSSYSNISENFNAFKKATNDLLSLVMQQKQPSLHYDIPDDVQQFRYFDSLTSSFQSPGIKKFAQFVLSVTKDSNSPDVKFLLKKWFDSTQEEIVNISKGIAQFKGEISKLLHDSKVNRSSFVRSISSLSVLLASNESNFDDSVSTAISELHKKIITNSCDFLKDPNEPQSKLMRIYCFITEIAALADISKLNEKEEVDFETDVLKRVIVSLNNMRQKSDTCDLDDKLSTIDSIEELSAFSTVKKTDNTNETLGLNDLLEKTVSGELSSSILNQFISTFSNNLLILAPSQFSILDSINDSDSTLDFLYDKAEDFGENVNIVLQFAKNKEKNDAEKIKGCLNMMILSGSDSSVLVNHSIKISGFDKSPLSPTFVTCCNVLFSSLRNFCEKSLQITKESDFYSELRKINRKMSAQFDVFISAVEDPESLKNSITLNISSSPRKSETDILQNVSESEKAEKLKEIEELQKTKEFEDKKSAACFKVSLVIVHVARILSLASRSLVIEMYEKERGQIEANLYDLILELQNSIDEVKKEAVGESPADFSLLISNINEHVESLMQTSKNLTFETTSLVPLPLLKPAEILISEVKKVADSVMNLTNKIIIKPDINAASRVPDDKALPHPPKETTQSLDDSIEKLLESKKEVDKNLSLFKDVIKNDFSTSEEIVRSIIDLRGSTDTFIDSALLVAVATVNPLYQVEQQASLHALVNCLNGLQNSTRDRLMRISNFESDLQKSIPLFESCLNKTAETAESASKDPQNYDNADEDDENLDVVTRELNATAAVIEKMSAKLKEFENQVNVDVFKDEEAFDEKKASEIEDIEAAADTLPAYLIAAADPILSSASKILKKAKQVTSNLLKKFGKIENEKGLINTAQDLSEAAELLLICAEILVSGNDNLAEFKAITAAQIIIAAVVAFHVQVLQKTGDDEGEIKVYINTVRKYSNSIVLRGKAIVSEKLIRSYEKKPKKKTGYLQKLEQAQIVNEWESKRIDAEKKLKDFRKEQHKNYHSPQKEKKT